MTDPIERAPGQLDPYHYDIDPDVIDRIDALEEEGLARIEARGGPKPQRAGDMTDEEVAAWFARERTLVAEEHLREG